MQHFRQLGAAILVALLFFSRAPADDAKAKRQYGTISGKFLFKGKIPRRKFALPPGDRFLAKHCPACLKQGVVYEGLLVDPESKGIANIFIYLRKAPTIHPKLRTSGAKTVECRFKGCRLLPHALIVRTEQTIFVRSRRKRAHHAHAQPIAQKQRY